MFLSIWEDFKRSFAHGNMVTRLIIANIIVFVAINLLKIILFAGAGGQTPLLYDDILHFFCLSSSVWKSLLHPWTLVTSMFLHEGFWHIVWNMLFLYWFGQIEGDFIGNHRVLPLYLLGGLVGALAFWLGALALPYSMGGGNNFALGASAAVMSFVVAAATISPDYLMRILLFGDVKLKYVAPVLFFLDLMGIANVNNTGGHFAHLGGAFFGWFFVTQLRNGRDFSAPINSAFAAISSFFQNIFSQKSASQKRPKPKMAYKNEDKKYQKTTSNQSNSSESFQSELDSILDKIKQTGYDSLTAEDKAFLFQASKK